MSPWKVEDTVTDGFQSLQIVAVWSPPKAEWTWRNLAVETFSLNETYIRVAVIWQSRSFGDQTSELYIHDLPCDIESRIITPNSDITGPSRSKPWQSDMVKGWQAQLPIAGKRIHSVQSQMGGIHPLSSISTNTPTNLPLTGLGGMRLALQITDHYDRHTRKQYCYIWGRVASASSSQHNLILFDLNPGSAAAVRYMMRHFASHSLIRNSIFHLDHGQASQTLEA